jgi:hypothetical protein
MPEPAETSERPGWLSRFGWFIALWAAGVASLAAAAWLLKALMRSVGLA